MLTLHNEIADGILQQQSHMTARLVTTNAELEHTAQGLQAEVARHAEANTRLTETQAMLDTRVQELQRCVMTRPAPPL